MAPKRKSPQIARNRDQHPNQNTAAEPPRKRTRSETKATSSSTSPPSNRAANKENKAHTYTPPTHIPSTTITLTQTQGDLFHDPTPPPPGTLLLHACNCTGTWGAGIAKAFRSRYPAAYATYHAHCVDTAPAPGSALLIPPPPPPSVSTSSAGEAESLGAIDGVDGVGTDEAAKGHWIGCLFTSRSKGRKKDSRAQILEATGRAMREMVRMVAESGRAGGGIAGVRMCRINAGLFDVPWEETRRVVEGVEVGEGAEVMREILVVARE